MSHLEPGPEPAPPSDAEGLSPASEKAMGGRYSANPPHSARQGSASSDGLHKRMTARLPSYHRHSEHGEHEAHGKHAHSTHGAGHHVLPFLIVPSKVQKGERPREWIPDKLLAPEWLSLFYDLAFVAILGIFTSVHELQSPARMVTFVSYFLLLYWVWFSQTSYDVRYQGNDWWAVICKFLQFTAISYLGAASSGWDLRYVLPPVNFMAPNATLEDSGFQSFRAVAIAFAASRGLLALEYLVVLVLAWRTRRPMSAIAIQAFLPFLSMVLAGVAASRTSAGPSDRPLKIALLYAGVFTEVLSELGVALWARDHTRHAPERMSERMALLTLIILGEGIIGILRATEVSLAVFSESDGPMYGQVVACLIVVFITALLSFDAFKKETWLGRKRTISWSAVQFPLQFSMLLLITSLVNALLAGAFTNGLTNISNLYLEGLLALPAPLTEFQNSTLTLQLGKLQLDSPFQQEMAVLNQSAAKGDERFYIEGIKYFTDINIQCATLYQIEIEDSVYALRDKLHAINAPAENFTAVEEATVEAAVLLTEVMSELLTASVQGTLWLLPSAGAVLLMSSISQIVRYEHTGYIIYVVEGLQIVIAVIFFFLGFLETNGPNKLILTFRHESAGNVLGEAKQPSTLFVLVMEQWAIAVVALTFFVLYLIKTMVLGVYHRTSTSTEALHGHDADAADAEVPLGVQTLDR